MNRMMLDMVAGLNAERDGVPVEAARQLLKDFYYWLHKAINLCKACYKGLSFTSQQEAMEAIDRQGDKNDDTFQILNTGDEPMSVVLRTNTQYSVTQ